MDSKRKRLLSRETAGFLILLVLLAAGLTGSRILCRHYDGIAARMDAAALYALSDGWEAAKVSWTGGRSRWEESWRISCIFADHSPMEEIDTLFARIAVYASEEEATEFAAACAEVARQMEAMSDAQRLTWWNLL